MFILDYVTFHETVSVVLYSSTLHCYILYIHIKGTDNVTTIMSHPPLNHRVTTELLHGQHKCNNLIVKLLFKEGLNFPALSP